MVSTNGNTGGGYGEWINGDGTDAVADETQVSYQSRRETMPIGRKDGLITDSTVATMRLTIPTPTSASDQPAMVTLEQQERVGGSHHAFVVSTNGVATPQGTP